MKKLYGDLNMSWLRVILSALLAGVYTGTMMLIPAFRDTSFQDIGIHYEWWVIFAVLIAGNCKSGPEAALKCFTFFLISQPAVYLVEILFGSLTFEYAWRYYRSYWLPMTFLTFPGGWIAHCCRKQGIAGGFILGLGNTIQLVFFLVYLTLMMRSFPHHLLSSLVCLGSIVIMTFHIQNSKKGRLTAILVPLLFTACLLVFLKRNGLVLI